MMIIKYNNENYSKNNSILDLYFCNIDNNINNTKNYTNKTIIITKSKTIVTIATCNRFQFTLGINKSYNNKNNTNANKR